MFLSIKSSNVPPYKRAASAVIKGILLATVITGSCAALFIWSTTLQALFMFTIAPTLLAAINSVSSIPLGYINNGFFVPNDFGLGLTACLLWGVVFLSVLVSAD